MASTYSSTLRLELIGNGDQSGTWGDTTNINLGSLIEAAITGVQPITMLDADYTLTAYNGLPDESRNAVLVVGGTNTASRNVIAPAVEKVYIVKNSTTGGYNIVIKTSGGAGITVPNGQTQIVYCDGTDFYNAASQLTVAAGTGISVSTVSGTATVTNAGVTAINSQTGSLTLAGGTGISVSGTSTQTVTNTGVTALAGATGITASASTGSVTVSPTSGYNGYGVRTVSTSSPTGGSDGDIWYKY